MATSKKGLQDIVHALDQGGLVPIIRIAMFGALIVAWFALAEVGDLETPRDALARLARRPDATGALAAAYLKQEDIRRLYDRRQKNLLDYAKKQVEGVDLSGKSDLKLIENVIRLIETSALEGDKVKRKDLVDAALDQLEIFNHPLDAAQLPSVAPGGPLPAHVAAELHLPPGNPGCPGA